MSESDWRESLGLEPPLGEKTGYDVMQVCLNGHVITDSAELLPDHKKAFCPDCGAATITACPSCSAPIQGHPKGSLSTRDTPAPQYCHACGAAYPWRQAALSAAIESLQMELDGDDAAAVPELVQAISIETPRTELAARKLKRLLPKLAAKLGDAAYAVAIKVISDVASETARKTLGL